jgi:hypothetical protein
MPDDDKPPRSLSARWQRVLKASAVSKRPFAIDAPAMALHRAYVQEWSSHEDAVRSHGVARRDSETVA